MSFKWMEEDKGTVGFGCFPRSRTEEVAEEGKMKEDDERFKKGCADLGDRGLFFHFKVLGPWARKWRHGNSGFH